MPTAAHAFASASVAPLQVYKAARSSASRSRGRRGCGSSVERGRRLFRCVVPRVPAVSTQSTRCEYPEYPAQVAAHLRLLLRPSLRRRTVGCLLIWFFLSFGFYGFSVWGACAAKRIH